VCKAVARNSADLNAVLGDCGVVPVLRTAIAAMADKHFCPKLKAAVETLAVIAKSREHQLL
jgi:hypothetical protein